MRGASRHVSPEPARVQRSQSLSRAGIDQSCGYPAFRSPAGSVSLKPASACPTIPVVGCAVPFLSLRVFFRRSVGFPSLEFYQFVDGLVYCLGSDHNSEPARFPQSVQPPPVPPSFCSLCL